MEITGKPVPYVACDIGGTTDGAIRWTASTWATRSSWSRGHHGRIHVERHSKAVGITDVVDAILIKDNFTIIDLCRSVTGEYRNLDLLVSDKVRIKDRGSNVTPNFIFDRDSIIGGDEPISVMRAGATAQRREHELVAIDPDQDYTAVPSLAKIPRDPMIISAAVGKETATLPLVIDANTRQALATFAQNYEENARRKVSLKVRADGYGIEPGDLFALTNIADGFDNEVFKVTSTTHGANWVVDIEGEAILRCSIYTEGEEPEGGYVHLCGTAEGAEAWACTVPGLLDCGFDLLDVGQMEDTPDCDPSSGVRALGSLHSGSRTVIGSWDPLPGNTMPFLDWFYAAKSRLVHHWHFRARQHRRVIRSAAGRARHAATRAGRACCRHC